MSSGDLETYICVKISKSIFFAIAILSLHSICSESKNPFVVGEISNTRIILEIFMRQSNKRRKYTSFSLSVMQQMHKKSNAGQKEVLARNFRFKKFK